MTNEEMQKAMEFVVNQQAQFAADIQKLEESQARTVELVGRLAIATEASFNEVREGMKELRESISSLVDAQMRTEENLNKTDEKVRNLTAVVDRYFREKLNGGT
ncbi:MAG TPA: hypothetical protein VFX96_20310 [Pyrinomonadaceae bacterium]|nr:hypothetical protein [Pyrinomonadaceae bacterium]